MQLNREAAARTRYVFRTLDEARRVAAEAAAACADRWRVEMALAELLVNAVEHGNLGIGTGRKAELLRAGDWEAEVARRLALPEFSGRSAWLLRERTDRAWRFEIGDEGAGFDWRACLGPDAARSAEPNGRGIALARRLAFADLHYLEPGNRLRCSVPLD